MDINNNNTNDQLTFNNFWRLFINFQYIDFHQTKYHENEDELIMDLATKSYRLLPCDISVGLYSDQCKSSQVVDDDTCNEELKYFHIYKEMIGSLHFYVFHLLVSGVMIHHILMNHFQEFQITLKIAKKK